jgi:hypothetical protein
MSDRALATLAVSCAAFSGLVAVVGLKAAKLPDWGFAALLALGAGLALVAVWALVRPDSPRLEVKARVAGEWAHLDVTNAGLRSALIEPQAKLLAGTSEGEDWYPIQWRDSEQPTRRVNGHRGRAILNVASGDIGPTGQGDLKYRYFTFHTAKLPVRGGQYKEAFPRTQVGTEGFILDVTLTSDPPLRKPVQKYYILRATDDPDWQVRDQSGTLSPPNPKIEFYEIDRDRAESIIDSEVRVT